MSSKGNGEGSIYYNKQRKKWNAQYKEYDTETGKMKYKTKSFKGGLSLFVMGKIIPAKLSIGLV